MKPTTQARTVAAAAASVAGLALVVIATRSGRTRDISPHNEPYHAPAPKVHGQPPQALPTAHSSQTPQASGPAPEWVHILLLVIMFGIGALVAAAAVLYVVRLLRRLDFHLPERERRPEIAFELAPEDVARAMTEAVDATLLAIERGETKEAIIACWLRLEDIAAAAGVERQPAETAADLTERVLATHQVSAATLSRLADLYREARYSAHSLDDSARVEARRALEQVRDELARPAEATP